MDDLRVVGRQVDTAGGPMDLLGVDGEGRLVVFELKRGALTREAVAQVIDYASHLAELQLDELANHISERSGNLGIEKIDNFVTWYQESFGRNLTWPQKPRLVLVGLGVDDRTRRMVSFLADGDIDISLVTLHGFKQGQGTLLARQVEVEAKAPEESTTVTMKKNLEMLQQNVEKLGVGEFYYKIAEFFRSQLPGYEWPNPGGYTYYLSEQTSSGTQSNFVYVSLYISNAFRGKTKIQIHPRAAKACSSSIEEYKGSIGGMLNMRNDGGAEIWIKSLSDWEHTKPNFDRLCPNIIEGWKKKREEKASEEFAEAKQDVPVTEYQDETANDSE
jgi:hypothetical protein